MSQMHNQFMRYWGTYSTSWDSLCTIKCFTGKNDTTRCNHTCSLCVHFHPKVAFICFLTCSCGKFVAIVLDVLLGSMTMISSSTVFSSMTPSGSCSSTALSTRCKTLAYWRHSCNWKRDWLCISWSFSIFWWAGSAHVLLLVPTTGCLQLCTVQLLPWLQ